MEVPGAGSREARLTVAVDVSLEGAGARRSRGREHATVSRPIAVYTGSAGVSPRRNQKL